MSCVLLRSGLGSPTDIAVVREATGLSVCCVSFLNITGFIAHNHFDLQGLFVRGKLWQVFETALKSGGVRPF